MTVRIDPDGTIQFIYSDQLRPLLDLGQADIRRASHVEPTQDGRWQADMSPVGGPALKPVDFRARALQVEREWIERHYLRASPDEHSTGAYSWEG